MMAAAARRSGTRSPLASTLKRGSTSAYSRAVAIARARASFARRVRERAAEYTGRGVAARTAALFFARALVAASLGDMPILTRLKSTRGPTQKTVFPFTEP